ncbi:MAG: guanitoxin biosynthesis heme-dependent pre-guanitoxin N-hydroxylase GntA [Burkholderiales bacterium]|nr:YqcI/YcgG family protein [Burkholderiales bacterium]MDQ3196240.1 YqcI/YcgG family protein [Pseudomonadota bacterium]
MTDLSIRARKSNPFDSTLARVNSNYAAYHDGELVRPLAPHLAPSALAEQVHGSFRDHVLDSDFSCVGAKSAISRGSYRLGQYGTLASAGATAGLACDLYEFVRDQASFEGGFSTFLASFANPVPQTEKEFERLLWAQLQHLHELDRAHHVWDPAVSNDPADAEFSFSFAEQGFFVIGLHPQSSRLARRFAWPALVFNPHNQFEQLRESGHFDRMQSVIRERELALQGSLNANLSNFGEQSEARQYSGRRVEVGWRCPFSPRNSIR